MGRMGKDRGRKAGREGRGTSSQEDEMRPRAAPQPGALGGWGPLSGQDTAPLGAGQALFETHEPVKSPGKVNEGPAVPH